MNEYQEREAIRGLAEIAKAQALYIRGLQLMVGQMWNAAVQANPDLKEILPEVEASNTVLVPEKLDALIQNIDAIIQQLGQK